MAERAFLGLGGNIGDPRAAMSAALHALAANGAVEIVAVSSLYRTPPWGRTDQPDFLNAVAEIATELSPRDLLDACLAAEARLHRVRDERWGPRTIDIDVLLYGQGAVAEPGLEIPHPRMVSRAFVLVPLAEIAPTLSFAGRGVTEWLADVPADGIAVAAGPGWWRGADA